MEDVNDVVSLQFLSNEGDTEIFYDNDNDAIESFIYFAVMEDKTIMDQKIIIISNIKPQTIFPKNFVVGSHDTNYATIPVLTTNTMVPSIEIFLVGMGKVFQSGGIKIVLIKSLFNRIHTQN